MNCLKVSCLGGSLESIDCLFLGKINVISSSDLSVVFQVQRLRETLYSAIVLQVHVVHSNQTLSSFHGSFLASYHRNLLHRKKNECTVLLPFLM